MCPARSRTCSGAEGPGLAGSPELVEEVERPCTVFHLPVWQNRAQRDTRDFERPRGEGGNAVGGGGRLNLFPGTGKNIPIFDTFRIDPLPDNVPFVATSLYSSRQTGILAKKSGKVGENNPAARVSPYKSPSPMFPLSPAHRSDLPFFFRSSWWNWPVCFWFSHYLARKTISQVRALSFCLTHGMENRTLHP